MTTTKNKRLYSLILGIVTLLLFTIEKTTIAQENNWTFFRGSNLNGVSANTGLPQSWKEDSCIKWKTPLSGTGISSPVVFGQQIWISTANPSGKELFAVCLDKESGIITQNIKLFQRDSAIGLHNMNSYATPTPAIEDGYVYIHFGTMGTSCINTQNSNVIWSRTDLNCNHVQGPASSPIIYKGLLILHLEGVDTQNIIVLDKKTGKTVWKAERPQEYYTDKEPIYRKAYITPIIINSNNQDMLISNGAEVCSAYEPLTGKEIWRINYSSETTISMPMFINGLVVFTTGFGRPVRLIAANPNGTGNITATNIVWQTDASVPGMNSPVGNKGLIYMIEDKGTITCLEAKTGTVVWKNRLKGEFYASPIIADGKIYCPSKQGTVYVLEEGSIFKLLAESKADGELWATMAVTGKYLLMRTNKSLYCIGKP